jgi:hypothetical protein
MFPPRIPSTPEPSDALTVGYLISSHVRYSVPLSRLLTSMAAVEKERIFVVIGGHARATTLSLSGIRLALATHNSFDHTAVIEFNRLRPVFPDHVFLLHDTTEFTGQTERLISQADPEKWATAATSKHDGAQCGLMLCRKDYLFRMQGQLTRFINCSKFNAIRGEGFLWKQCPREHRAIYPDDDVITEGIRAEYHGAPRLVEFYRAVALRKFKANWGQHRRRHVTIP